MLTSTFDTGLRINVVNDSSYVSFFPGALQIDSSVLDFRGGKLDFTDMVNFGDSTSAYQYSLAYIENTNTLDVTTSEVQTYLKNIIPPTVPSNSKAVGLFTFQTEDSTVSLLTSKRIY